MVGLWIWAAGCLQYYGNLGCASRIRTGVIHKRSEKGGGSYGRAGWVIRGRVGVSLDPLHKGEGMT